MRNAARSIALLALLALTTPALAAAPEGRATDALKELYAVLTCDRAGHKLEIDDYEAYCARFAEYMASNRRDFVAQAKPWIAAKRPAGLPSTMLYPFAGADLLTSLVAFPDAARYVHLTLDDVGRPDGLQRLSPNRRKIALRTLMDDAAKWLLVKGYNSTDSLRRTMEEKLPGMLPTILLGLAVHQGEVVGIRYFRVGPDGKPVYFNDAELALDQPIKKGLRKEFECAELHFKLPGSDQVRVFQHVWANLGDKWLQSHKGAGVVAFVKQLGKVGFLTKANEYNIWRRSFSVIRDLALAQAQWMVSDSSGVPTRYLEGTPWELEVHGTFLCDKANMRNKIPGLMAINNEMVAYFKAHTKGDLAFRFGYGDCRRNNHIMVHRRRDQAAAQ